jgi:hypothetical protein
MKQKQPNPVSKQALSAQATRAAAKRRARTKRGSGKTTESDR